jgi:hypothetical protein
MNRKSNEKKQHNEHHRAEKKKKHRVRSNHWVQGVLGSIDTLFDNLEEAIEYAEGLDCSSAKVYDADNCVVKEYHGKHKDKDHHPYA